MEEGGAEWVAPSHGAGSNLKILIFLFTKNTKQNKTKQNKRNSFTHTKQITKYYTQTKQP
jgi:hypothetical protein